MTQIAATALGAHKGIGGHIDDCPRAPCRITSDLEQLREEFFAYLIQHIGQDLTAEEMRTLMQPVAAGNVRFRVDEALKKVASWYKPKTA